MATTTPNFGWAVPTSTDLVKDGAVAIETLGDSIDASLVDLKGGTTGQVLAKATNTDMDFSWVAIDPLVILDAKGDLITATAADTPARLAVGTNAQVLTADSTTATGLKWATPSGSAVVGCMLRKSADQTISNSTFTAVTFNTEVFDTDSFHDNSTNTSRITIPSGKGGKYVVYAGLEYLANASNSRRLAVATNTISGTINAYQFTGGFSGAPSTISFVGMANFTAGDYVEAFAWQDSGGNLDVNGDTAGGCWFGVQYLGA
jgi:hypothetical protein